MLLLLCVCAPVLLTYYFSIALQSTTSPPSVPGTLITLSFAIEGGREGEGEGIRPQKPNASNIGSCAVWSQIRANHPCHPLPPMHQDRYKKKHQRRNILPSPKHKEALPKKAPAASSVCVCVSVCGCSAGSLLLMWVCRWCALIIPHRCCSGCC